MVREEIYKELQMTYEELQRYLIRKYGGAEYDYFATPECKSKNKKVSRTKEGLYCHHMDEDKGGNLSDPRSAKLQPFEWQRKERLVYCNVLEHLILHIKIAILRQKAVLEKPKDVIGFFTTGGIFMLCAEINDMFIKRETLVEWKKRCYEEVKENYKDYKILLQAVLAYIDANYVGEKTKDAFLVPGSIIHFDDYDCEILKVNTQKNIIQLRLPTGEEKSYKSDIAIHQFTYADYINMVVGEMASGYDIFYVRIYEDILGDNDNKAEIKESMKFFKGDFVGHGFADYANIYLNDSYGAKNADAYISKTLPIGHEIPEKTDSKHNSRNDENYIFKVGDIVTHSSFGKGTVLKIEEIYGLCSIIVEFDNIGQKKIVSSYLRLYNSN